ncbi:hypothetical protein [Glaciihabitans tibetensis]|nr:hypothetical protein [Glaciihabitans tibetensis]
MIHPFTRVVALVILPFLAVAAVLLIGFATRTDALFAWTIAPPLTAMLLGAAYVGGLVYFANLLRLRRWHRVQYGIPAVFLFASLLAIATLLHWDRFHPGHLSFIVWAVLYVTTPVLIVVVWVLNRTADTGKPEDTDIRIPLFARLAFASLGLASLLAGALLFVFPAAVVDVWAWDVTPLTGRVVGAILTLPGAVNAWMLVDDRWTSFKWMMQAQLVSLAFIVLALLLSGSDLRGERIASPLFVGMIGAAVIGYAWLYVYCERRLQLQRVAPRHP